MLVLNPDLINSCRVCRNPNQDGDYECLYQFIPNKRGDNQVLSEAGSLYENLLNISLNAWYYGPQFLCNSCDLQMKLFKKLKDKAHTTLEYLQNHYEKEMGKATEDIDLQATVAVEQEPVANNTDFVQEYRDDHQEGEFEVYHENGINEYAGNFAGEFERYAAYQHQEDKPNENEDNMAKEYQKYTPNVHQENGENECHEHFYDECKEEKLGAFNTYKNDVSSTVTSTENIPIISNNFVENKFELNTAPTEEIKETPLTVDISKLEPLLDKNDYVTEIYELLEDEEKTEAYSENSQNIIEFGVYTDERTETSSVFSDIEYVVEEIEHHQEIQNSNPPKNRCIAMKNATTPNNTKYKCKPCQLEFEILQEYTLHRTQIHHERHICNICSKELKSTVALYNHMKLHTDQPEYQCEICQKTFYQKVHYQYHMNHHNNVRNFKCNVCEKAFISKTDLKVHMRFHSGKRPYVCNICGKDYLMTEHLKTHLLSHTKQHFLCEICNHKFTTHKTLRLHVRTIHEDEPKFKCSFCLKPFRRKHHLEYHMKVHEKNVESLYETIDESVIDESDYKADFLDEQDMVEDPGFIALNDDIL